MSSSSKAQNVELKARREAAMAQVEKAKTAEREIILDEILSHGLDGMVRNRPVFDVENRESEDESQWRFKLRKKGGGRFFEVSQYYQVASGEDLTSTLKKCVMRIQQATEHTNKNGGFYNFVDSKSLDMLFQHCIDNGTIQRLDRRSEKLPEKEETEEQDEQNEEKPDKDEQKKEKPVNDPKANLTEEQVEDITSQVAFYRTKPRVHVYFKHEKQEFNNKPSDLYAILHENKNTSTWEDWIGYVLMFTSIGMMLHVLAPKQLKQLSTYAAIGLLSYPFAMITVIMALSVVGKLMTRLTYYRSQGKITRLYFPNATKSPTTFGILTPFSKDIELEEGISYKIGLQETLAAYETEFSQVSEIALLLTIIIVFVNREQFLTAISMNTPTSDLIEPEIDTTTTNWRNIDGEL